MSRHTFTPRDAKGKEYGVEIEYEFEREQLERGQFGRREDATPPIPATVTINKVLCVEKDIMEWLDSMDINWERVEQQILDHHSDE